MSLISAVLDIATPTRDSESRHACAAPVTRFLPALGRAASLRAASRQPVPRRRDARALLRCATRDRQWVPIRIHSIGRSIPGVPEIANPRPDVAQEGVVVRLRSHVSTRSRPSVFVSAAGGLAATQPLSHSWPTPRQCPAWIVCRHISTRATDARHAADECLRGNSD
jgi:hypothetical protein